MFPFLKESGLNVMVWGHNWRKAKTLELKGVVPLPQSQYIQTIAELGIVGLLLLLLIFSSLIKRGIIKKDSFLLSFLILIIVICITESFLWRQRGMVFFITISLLYTRKNSHKI